MQLWQLRKDTVAVQIVSERCKVDHKYFKQGNVGSWCYVKRNVMQSESDVMEEGIKGD